MNITQDRIDDLNMVIKVHLEPGDYSEQVKEEIKKYARRATLPGFRPGKVPFSLVKKMMGTSVVVDTVQKTLQEKLQQFIEEEKLELLGEPLPTEQKDESYFDPNCEKDLEFAFEIGLAPKFELNLELQDPVTQYKIDIDDAYLDKEIENLRDRYADFNNPDEVEKGDIIFGKLYEANEAGEPVEEGFEKMVALNPKRIESGALFEPFIGKKVDDAVPFSLQDLAGNDEERGKLLMLSPEEVAEIQDKNLYFRVMRISRIILAEVNEALIKKALGEDTEVTDEAGLREELKKSLASQLERQARYHYRSEVRKALEANHSMEFPETFLKKWMKESYEKVNDENVDEQYQSMAESLKWSLIVEKIRKAHPEIDIQPDEVGDAIKDSLRKTMGEELTEEDLDQYTQYIISNEELLKQHFYRILDDKLFEALEEKVPVAEKSISATDFEALED